MSPLKTAVRRTSSALLMLALLASSGTLAIVQTAGPPDSPSTTVTAMSGTGLTFAECQKRAQEMNRVLVQAGYSSMRQYARGDTMVARWYHSQRDTTTLAFCGSQPSNNAFSVVEVPGLVRWNELIPVP